MKPFVLFLIFVLAPPLLNAGVDHGTTTYADGTNNANDKCREIVCPGYTTWICDCPKCSEECAETVTNEPFPLMDYEAECELSGGDGLYVDGRWVTCGDDVPPKVNSANKI